MAEEETYDFDPWSTSSGLPAFMQVRIENPHFGFDAKVQDGQRCLFIPEGTVLSGDGIDEPTEFTQFYSCGPGWEPEGKGGTRVKREDGKMRPFNENVAYAKLFTSLMVAANEQGLLDDLKKRGTPFTASLWQDMLLDLERVEGEPFEGSDGKTHTPNYLLVKNIVKMGDSKPAAGSDETVTGKATVGSSSAASTNGAVDAKTKAKLKVLARECKSEGVSHAQFVERAFEVEGVLDNNEAEALVMDEGEGSLWDEATT